MGLEAQRGFIPSHSGQPSARAAWQHEGVNAAAGQFYCSTAETTESAWVRPRFDGYIAFQNAGAEIIRNGLAAETAPAAIFADLRDLWHRARDAARGPLT
jgi:multiple sugar transport system substrate-binding protein